MMELLRAMSLAGWWEAVLRLSVASGAVLLVVLVLDVALARKVSARWRAALYVAVLVRVLLPSQWASPLGLLQREVAVVAATSVIEAPAVASSAVAVPAAPLVASSAVFAPLVLQCGVALALLMAWVVARVLLARSLREAHPAGDRVRALAPAGLRVVEHATHGPAVFGVFRPRVVVPSPLVRALDDDALAAVLRHEAAHVSRRDPLTLALLQVLTFMAWPLLPAWIAAWRVRGLMEQACDEAALREVGAEQRRAYGEVLIKVAEWQPLRATLALGMLSFGGGLAPRMRALRFTRRWPAWAQVALVASAAVGVLLASGSRVVRAQAAAGAPRARLTLQAWIVEDDAARGLWPIPGGLESTPPNVMGSSTINPLTDDEMAGVRERLEAAVAAGWAREFAGLSSRTVIGSGMGPTALRRDGLPYQLDIALVPRGDATGLTADITTEWGGIPAGPPVAAPWKSLPDMRYEKNHGAGLGLLSATRLADGRWAFMTISGYVLADSSPAGLVLENLHHHCGNDARVDVDGEAARATGTCPTKAEFANFLRDLEDASQAADVALFSMVEEPSGVRFDVGFRLVRRVQVSMRILRVDASALPELALGDGKPGTVWDMGDPASEFSLDVAILGLEGKGRLRTVSRPMVMLEMGKEGVITSGSEPDMLKVGVRVEPKGAHLRTQLSLEDERLVGAEPLRVDTEAAAWAIARPIAGTKQVALVVVIAREQLPD